MWLKKKSWLRIPKTRKPNFNPPGQDRRNEDTTARVAAVLASVNAKNYVVLAKAESDSGGADYEIRLGTNHAVFCSCKGWQYSKNGTCKHLERWKQQVKPITVVSDKR